MFIIYLLLVLMGLIIANFVVTYALYSAIDRDMREQIDRLKHRLSDSNARMISLYEDIKSEFGSLEARCKKFVGRSKKSRAPEVKSEAKK